MTEATRYHKTYRRMLLDMHIPDWDNEFLKDYEPESLADVYAHSEVEGVLYYCKSHMGHNYWPCPVGSVHPKAANRDLVGELYTALRSRGISPAAYHTVVFDNWAVLNHPEWKCQPLTEPGEHPFLMSERYGTACPNNLEYRKYETDQIQALLKRYDFDALFIDMTFWTGVCACKVCRKRFEDETGLEFPTVINWSDSRWVTLQSKREEWLEEFILQMFSAVRQVRANIAVTHNMGPGTHGWYTGQKIDFSQHATFAAGDIYGGKGEQLVISKLLLHVGKEQPAEFMTTRTLNLQNHNALKTEHMMMSEVLATYAHHSAFLFIDAIDLRGTICRGVYDRIKRIFEYTKQFQPFLGGIPVEDVMLYYSDDSRVDPGFENDLAVTKATSRKEHTPHLLAITGAAAQLAKAHIPFGVFTKHNLGRISKYRVVVLPDLIRVDQKEVEAFRDYVHGGGSLYVSGRTSLLTTDGQVQEDFLLNDVLGVKLDKIEDGAGVFIKAESPLIADALHPETYLSVGFTAIPTIHEEKLRLPRLSPESSGKVLGSLNLPYGYPSKGKLGQEDFGSIHSSPPWTDTKSPAIVENDFGSGRSVYSISPVERGSTPLDEQVFISLIRSLLGNSASLEVDTTPDTWVMLFDQPERRRLVISAVVYNVEFNPGFVHFRFRLRAKGGQIKEIIQVPSEKPVPFTRDGGCISIEDQPFETFCMYIASY